jgi:hypothetical protein
MPFQKRGNTDALQTLRETAHARKYREAFGVRRYSRAFVGGSIPLNPAGLRHSRAPTPSTIPSFHQPIPKEMAATVFRAVAANECPLTRLFTA